jgi:hypothetical protein
LIDERERMLQVGKSYTRGEIHRILGGGVRDYLPHKDGQVVCGCFKKETNPNAPDIVLPGRGTSIQHWAEVFRAQTNPIPVFIKRAVNEWEYVGDYRVDRWTDEQSEIAEYSAETNLQKGYPNS